MSMFTRLYAKSNLLALRVISSMRVVYVCVCLGCPCTCVVWRVKFERGADGRIMGCRNLHVLEKCDIDTAIENTSTI